MKTTRIISIFLLLLAGLTLAAQQVIVFRRAPVSTDNAGSFNGTTSTMKG
jgi:hypothetical protein